MNMFRGIPVFEVIEAVVLRIASYERKSSFTQDNILKNDYRIL